MRMESSAFATIERTVLRRVDQVLRPELVARINEKLVFNRLPYAIQREICELMIGREVERLNQLGHKLVIEPATVEILVREGFHRTLGARPMRNTVDRYLQEAVANVCLKRQDLDRICVQLATRRSDPFKLCVEGLDRSIIGINRFLKVGVGRIV